MNMKTLRCDDCNTPLELARGMRGHEYYCPVCMIAEATKGQTMQEHQKRVVTEKEELDAKLMKLIAFFDTSTFAGLEVAEQDRLMRQSRIMTDYSVVLGERIAAF